MKSKLTIFGYLTVAATLGFSVYYMIRVYYVERSDMTGIIMNDLTRREAKWRATTEDERLEMKRRSHADETGEGIVQPVNRKEPCLISLEHLSSGSHTQVLWDGDCRAGHAAGIGLIQDLSASPLSGAIVSLGSGQEEQSSLAQDRVPIGHGPDSSDPPHICWIRQFKTGENTGLCLVFSETDYHPDGSGPDPGECPDTRDSRSSVYHYRSSVPVRMAFGADHSHGDYNIVAEFAEAGNHTVSPSIITYRLDDSQLAYLGLQQIGRQDYRELLLMADPDSLKKENSRSHSFAYMYARTELNGEINYLGPHGYAAKDTVPDDFFDDARLRLSSVASIAGEGLTAYLKPINCSESTGHFTVTPSRIQPAVLNRMWKRPSADLPQRCSTLKTLPVTS